MQFTVHPALGGLDISSDPTILDPNFLTIADNVEYLEGGQRKKRLGSLQYAPTSSYAGTFTNVMVTSSSNVRAIKDYWRYGASLTPDHQYVAITGASIFKSTGDGLWHAVTVSSSFGSNATVTANITIAQDYAICSDGVAIPVAYDMATTSLQTPSMQVNQNPIFVTFATTGGNGLQVTTTAPLTITSSASSITFSSTSPITVNSSNTDITSTSTQTGAIFTSTALSVMLTSSLTVFTITSSQSTIGTPITVTATADIKFQSVLTGISAFISNAPAKVTFTSTNPYSNWPIFESCVYHLDRLFMSGLTTSPSDIRYTAAGNIFDSTGSDTGTLPIDRGDGDRVIGTSKTFYGSIYAYKGPQGGSVHQISGNTPATFTLAKVAHGAPAMVPGGIVSTPTDVYWISFYGTHSLETTVKFGNVEQAFLSLPIQRLWRDGLLKRDDLTSARGFWNPTRNIVGWIVTPTGQAGQGARNWVLVYNYALSDPKPSGKKFWSIWKLSGYGACSMEVLLNHVGNATWRPLNQGEPHLFIGGDNGLVYQADWATLADDLLPYTATIQTPTITRYPVPGHPVPETQEKIHQGVVTYYNSGGKSVSANLSVIVDQRQQSQTIALTGGGDPLG